MLFRSLVFSTSTSSYIAFPFALLIYCLFQRKLNLSIALIVLLFAGAVATLYFVYPETFDSMFTDKVNATNDSGAIHQETMQAMNETVETFTFMNRLFGIGFGYFYGSVFNSVLINTGWIGMAVFLYAFLKPVILLRSDNEGLALKVAVATLLFLFCINVSELFLPTTWMFLGLAYGRLDQQGQEKGAFRTARAPVVAEISVPPPSRWNRDAT